MIIGVGNKVDTKCTLNFGTHNGRHHGDETVGMSILELAHMEDEVFVVRTRDVDELNKLDIVIDIGGGSLDHHIPGFNVCRPNGKKYASAGLVWREFGEKAIRNVMLAKGLCINDTEIQIVKEQIDTEIIIPVDMEDSGDFSNHTFSFVSKFLPCWFDKTPNYDEAFSNAVATVSSILEEIIKDKIVQIITNKELQNRYQYITDGIWEIPSQIMPWHEEVLRYNSHHDNEVKFMLFPYPAGGWAAECVPPSIEERKKQLVPFPKEWAGGNEETLPKISGIPDATFCHNDRFFAKAKTKQGMIDMCRIAMK